MVYSLLSYHHFSSDLAPFLLAVLLVPLQYWNQASNSVASGYRPTALGYATLVSEVTKLLVAYPALFVFKLEIDGVILALMASYLVQAVVTTVLVRGAATDSLSLSVGKRWFSDFWVPAFYGLGSVITAADTVTAAVVTGGTLLTGYYQAAFQVGSLVFYAVYLSNALYPLLLRGASDETPNATLDLMLMFAIPMTVGAIVLAPNLLRILSPKYVTGGADVSVALGILAVVGLASAVSSFLDSTLIGRERADLNPERGFKVYVQSMFSFVATVNLTNAIAYIVSVALTTGLGMAAGLDISTIVAVWAGSQLLIITVALLVKLRRLRSVAVLRFPSSLPRYLLLSVVMAAFLYFLSAVCLQGSFNRLTYGTRLVEVALGGVVVYFGILLLTDRKSRQLAAGLLRWLT